MKYVLSWTLIYLILGYGVSNAADVAFTNKEECAFELSGEITPGDAKELEKFYLEHPPRPLYSRDHSVCLNSNGGSYYEALEVSALLFSNGISTVIPYGSICYSACAIIFMSGVYGDFDPTTHTYSALAPGRSLSVGGIIGFHAPYISLPKGEYTSENMESASRGMTKALLDLIELSSRNTLLKGNLIKGSLVRGIMSKGPNEALFVETIFDAARWEINLFDAHKYFRIDLKRNVDRNVKHLCKNFHFSNVDNEIPENLPLSVEVEEYSSKLSENDYRFLVKLDNVVMCEIYIRNTTLSETKYWIEGCSYDWNRDRSFGDCRDYKKYTSLIGINIPAYYSLAPDTILIPYKR